MKDDSHSEDSHKRVAAAAAAGEMADFTQPSDPDDLVLLSDDAWAGRTINGEWLARLCGRADANIHHRGIRIFGARIVGSLDLEGASLNRILVLRRCLIDSEVSLRDAHAQRIDLSESVCASIVATGLRAESDLVLRHTRITGGLNLGSAEIQGDVFASGATVTHLASTAITAENVHITGDMYLDGAFAADGQVRLLGAQIERLSRSS